MKDVHIAFTGQRKRITLVASSSKFLSHPRNWLERALWNLLVRLGAVRPVMEEHIAYTEIILRTDDILREIAQQRSYVFEETDDKPLRIIMGRDKFTQLANLPYDTQMHYGVILHKDPLTMMGMEITIVPWMTGLVVLP